MDIKEFIKKTLSDLDLVALYRKSKNNGDKETLELVSAELDNRQYENKIIDSLKGKAGPWRAYLAASPGEISPWHEETDKVFVGQDKPVEAQDWKPDGTPIIPKNAYIYPERLSSDMAKRIVERLNSLPDQAFVETLARLEKKVDEIFRVQQRILEEISIAPVDTFKGEIWE